MRTTLLIIDSLDRPTYLPLRQAVPMAGEAERQSSGQQVASPTTSLRSAGGFTMKRWSVSRSIECWRYRSNSFAHPTTMSPKTATARYLGPGACGMIVRYGELQLEAAHSHQVSRYTGSYARSSYVLSPTVSTPHSEGLPLRLPWGPWPRLQL